MVVVADVRGCLRVFGFRFQLRGVGDVGLADDPDAGVDGWWSGDGLGLPDAFQGLEGVDFGSLQDGGQVLLLGLQNELGLRAGLRADRRERALVALDFCPLQKNINFIKIYYSECLKPLLKKLERFYNLNTLVRCRRQIRLINYIDKTNQYRARSKTNLYAPCYIIGSTIRY